MPIVSQYSVRGGVVDLTLDLTPTGAPTQNMLVDKMGAIKFDFDVESDSEDDNGILREIYMGTGKLSLTVWDKTDGDNDIFTLIENEADLGNDVSLTFEFTPRGSGSPALSLTFIVVYEETKTDMRSRKTFITARPFDYTTIDIQNDEIMIAYSAEKENYDTLAGISSECMPAQKYIESTLDAIWNSAGAPHSNTITVINRTKNFTTENKVNGSKSMVFGKLVAGGASFEQSLDEVVKLLALEGSVLVYGFDEVCAFHRLDTTGAVSLSTSDVEKAEKLIRIKTHESVRVVASRYSDALASPEHAGTWVMDYINKGVSDGMAKVGEKRLEVFLPFFDQFTGEPQSELVTAQWQDSGTKYVETTPSTISDTGDTALIDAKRGSTTIQLSGSSSSYSVGDMIIADDLTQVNYRNAGIRTLPARVESQSGDILTLSTPLTFDIPAGAKIIKCTNSVLNSYAQDGCDAYREAYSGGARKVKVVIFGVETIKPQDPFILDSSFDASIQGTYRPSSMEYDFSTDRITVEGYKIA